MIMRKTLILMFACMCLAFSANAQRNSGRLSLGVGLLYRNGMDVTFSYEHEMNYRHAWEFFPTATCSGPNAARAAISVRNPSGATTAPMALAWHTSLAWYGAAIITATCV